MKPICPAPPRPALVEAGAGPRCTYVMSNRTPTLPLPPTSSLSLSQGRKKEIYGVEAFVLGRGWLVGCQDACLPSLPNAKGFQQSPECSNYAFYHLLIRLLLTDAMIRGEEVGGRETRREEEVKEVGSLVI